MSLTLTLILYGGHGAGLRLVRVAHKAKASPVADHKDERSA